MKVIGITGGIGSGKSIVCLVFRKLGIPVYSADSAVHDLYDKHPELTEKIINEFSPDVTDKSGKINRKKLAEVVFTNEANLEKLNSLVHPVVMDDFRKWSEAQKGFPYLLKEAAILFESGSDEGCDKVITISAPAELRISRVRERDHKTKAEIELIMSRQMGEEERNAKADFIIFNDENQLIIPQILKIHSQLIK
jgi:dephospho-CoA kinase